jgi:hypothetical protein
VRYRSRRVEIDGVVYQVRARGERDGPVQVQVQVRGGGEAGELVAPADHLAALGLAVVELARVFGGRTWTVAEARQMHRSAYTHWTEEDEARLAAEFAAGRTVEELADLFGRKPSAIESRLRRLGLLG